MNPKHSLSFTLSAVTFACILEKANEPAFWSEHYITASIMGLATASNFIVGGWFLLKEGDKPTTNNFNIWGVAVMTAVFAIQLFLITLSLSLGMTFAVGTLFTALLFRRIQQADEGKDKLDGAKDPAPPASS